MSLSEIISKANWAAGSFDKIMTDAGGNGKESVSATFMRWLISLMLAGMMGMAGLLWANLTTQLNNMKDDNRAQISELKSQIAETRADNRITQKDYYDLRASIQELTARVNDFVKTLNRREEEKISPKK